MHKAQEVANRIFSRLKNGVETTSCTLTSNDAKNLRLSLQKDAAEQLYSGVFSLAESIQGLDRGLYSWTTVKLYYSAFYFARATLGLNGVGIIHRNGKPFQWTASAGEFPSKCKGNTHKATLNALQHYQQNSILFSQPIGVENPYDWLISKRELVNYNIPKFCEPDTPPYFKFIKKLGVRRLVGTYADDASHLYTFDPDHAMLAFPMAALNLLIADFKRLGVPGLSREDVIYLASQAFDSKGPLSNFQRILLA